MTATSAKPLRVAVVGLGIGAAHLDGFRALPEHYEVVALCDADATRAERHRASFPGAVVTADLADVLANPEVDIVDLCTPPFLHFEQASASLESGKHVICEKPLVGSLTHLDALSNLSDRHRRSVMPVFQYRFGAGLARLQALQSAGLTGRPFVTSVEVMWSRGAWYYEAPWRGRWESELGGILLSHCVHALDLTTSALGPAVKAFGRISTRVNPIETDDCAIASIEIHDGSFVGLTATLGSAEEISRHRFCFEGLVAESNLRPYSSSGDPWRFVAADPGLQARVDEVAGSVVVGSEGYERQFELAAPAFRGEGELPVTLADAKAALGLVAALYVSARTGTDVELPMQPGDRGYDGWQP